MKKQTIRPNSRKRTVIPTGVGVVLGVALGAAIGNIALGLAVGIILGGMGTLWRMRTS